MAKKDYGQLFEELKLVSKQALAECPAPTPMIVGYPSTPLGNDVDLSKEHWFVADGVCGFAWVILESGRTGFAQWLLKNDLGRKWWSYGRTKGVVVNTYDRYGFANIGQSYEKNKFVANKIAARLRAEGIDAWVDARVD
jgi:hypothetical protein